MSHKVVLLFSGGVDSTVLAHLALERDLELVCLHFRYLQPAGGQEAEAAIRWCHKHGVKLMTRSITLWGLEDMHAEPGAVGPRVVPLRNLCMLALAANYAAGIGAKEVWFGANLDDHKDYLDCRPYFVQEFGLVVSQQIGIVIRAPLITMTKTQILERADQLDVDLEACWWCYAPVDGKPCGTCNSCRSNQR
ncbi:MAG: hypothetical protein GY913_21630 [Proteobacteria bacterium]|nr:hypothetical protein [Actinomycetes bacterium]MCP4919511.1 hypothetical protein [Pseudomonadota bacterium]